MGAFLVFLFDVVLTLTPMCEYGTNLTEQGNDRESVGRLGSFRHVVVQVGVIAQNVHLKPEVTVMATKVTTGGDNYFDSPIISEFRKIIWPNIFTICFHSLPN